jgi:hypothetical protein
MKRIKQEIYKKATERERRKKGKKEKGKDNKRQI